MLLHKFRLALFVAAVLAVVFNARCTYDANPPSAAQLDNAKPLVMIDASGFIAARAVQVQYTDLLGTVTLQSAAEKTDSSGRFLYPLYLTHGTRSFSLSIIMDQNGNGSFLPAIGNRRYQWASAFTSDSETIPLVLTNSVNFSAY